MCAAPPNPSQVSCALTDEVVAHGVMRAQRTVCGQAGPRCNAPAGLSRIARHLSRIWHQSRFGGQRGARLIFWPVHTCESRRSHSARDARSHATTSAPIREPARAVVSAPFTSLIIVSSQQPARHQRQRSRAPRPPRLTRLSDNIPRMVMLRAADALELVPAPERDISALTLCLDDGGWAS